MMQQQHLPQLFIDASLGLLLYYEGGFCKLVIVVYMISDTFNYKSVAGLVKGFQVCRFQFHFSEFEIGRFVEREEKLERESRNLDREVQRRAAGVPSFDETKTTSSSLRPSQLRTRFESRFLPPASFPVSDPCGGRRSIAGVSSDPFKVNYVAGTTLAHSKPTKLYDLEVIVLRFMELWDVAEEYQSNTMPTYRTEELQQVREKYVCDWILDVDNVRRDEVLQDLDLM
ncbi:uncharacterized protein HKW66_Vig0240220 [Vigna angularis]|uniref:Uncharacterized protein n=1 Tax=Phaseolus angularis TaxID=3914 RepID=A0A8T0JI31_PHAAN|nr:uncharacterized protein HKW66_Vig0240220 [Vigna angularis]